MPKGEITTVIYRTVTTTACNGQTVNPETGEFEDYTEVIYFAATPARATSYLRKRERDPNIVINNVEVETHRYAMSMAQFCATARIIDQN